MISVNLRGRANPSAIEGKNKMPITDKPNRTREKDFYLPILRAIHELGGIAHLDDVLARVESSMGHRLTEWDREPIPTRISEPR